MTCTLCMDCIDDVHMQCYGRMHMARHPLTDFEKESSRAWMKERRGETSQAALVEDIKRTIKWGITRDRYSKYESGGIDFGRGTLEKFIDYWAKKGQAGPDLSPPTVVAPADPMAEAIAKLAASQIVLAASQTALTKELSVIRREREAWARGVVAVLRAYDAGQVPEELLDALVPQALEPAPR